MQSPFFCEWNSDGDKSQSKNVNFSSINTLKEKRENDEEDVDDLIFIS